MSCEISKGVGIIDCDFCRKNLDVIFHCFSEEKESHHFCSSICFENYLLENNEKNLKQVAAEK